MKHTNLIDEIDAHTAPTPLWTYAILVLVGIGIGIIIFELIFSDRVDAWMYDTNSGCIASAYQAEKNGFDLAENLAACK